MDGHNQYLAVLKKEEVSKCRANRARNSAIESTFEVGRRFRCTMRIDCGQLDPGAVIRPVSRRMGPAYARAPRIIMVLQKVLREDEGCGQAPMPSRRQHR